MGFVVGGCRGKKFVFLLSTTIASAATMSSPLELNGEEEGEEGGCKDSCHTISQRDKCTKTSINQSIPSPLLQQ